MPSAFITRISFLACLTLAVRSAPAHPVRTPYLLSPLTGPVLDYNEIRRYGLAALMQLDFWTLDSIRVFSLGDSRYELEIYDRETGLQRMRLQAGEVAALRSQIETAEQALIQQLASLRAALAQGPVLSQIVLRSQKVLLVPVLAASGTHLTLSLPIGAQLLAIELIEQVQCLDEAIDPRYEYANPVASRYVLGQSAAPLRRGHGYFQNTMLMFNTLSYGLTDRLTATFSMELMTPYLKAQGWLIDSSAFMLSGLSLKYGGRIAPRWHAAGGVMLIGTVLGQIGGAPYVYGIATYGSAEHHLSIRPGILFGRLNAEAQQTHPSLTVSGLTRVSRQIALIAEAGVIRQRIRYFDSPAGAALEEYYSDRYQMTVSASMRVMSRKWAADLGMSAYGVRGIDRIRGEQPHYSKFDLFPFAVPHISVSRAF
jgi:hypothetical protein